MNPMQTARNTALVLTCTLCMSLPFAHAQPATQSDGYSDSHSNSGSANQSDSRSDAGRRRRHGPPPEAIDACTNQAENAACEFIRFNGRTLEGTCILPRGSGNELVCAPEGGRMHRRSRGRNSAASQDCGKSRGDG